jgi:hypothetical protein
VQASGSKPGLVCSRVSLLVQAVACVLQLVHWPVQPNDGRTPSPEGLLGPVNSALVGPIQEVTDEAYAGVRVLATRLFGGHLLGRQA